MKRKHALFGFKHISGKYAGGLLSCRNIQLGTFGYFREKEFDRVDPQEGVHDYSANGTLAYGSAAAKNLDLIRGVKLGPRAKGTHLELSNNSFSYVLPESPIFCVSRAPDFERCRDTDEVILRIALRPFAREILKANPDLIDFRILDVVYRKQTTEVFGNFEAPHFALKPEKFAYENETRIVFLTSKPKGAFQIAAPNAARWVTEVPIPEK